MGRYLDALPLFLTFFTLTAPIPAGILGGQNNCFRTSDKNLIITLEKDFKEGGFTVSAYGDNATVRQVEILTAATWDTSKKSFLCYWKHEYASNCSLSEDGMKIILKLELQLFDNYTVQLSSSAGEQKTANAFSCSDSFDEPKQTVAATPSSELMPILSMVMSVFACIFTLSCNIKQICNQIRSKYSQWKNGNTMDEPDSSHEESTVHGNGDDTTVDDKLAFPELKEKLDSTKKDLAELKTFCSDLEGKLDQQKKDKEELQKKLAFPELKENLDSTKKDLAELKTFCSDLEGKLDQQKKDKEELQKKLAFPELKEKLDSTKKDLAELKTFCSDLEGKLDQQKKDKEELQKKLAFPELKEKLDSTKKDLAELKTFCSDLEGKLDQQKKDKEELQKKLVRLESAFEAFKKVTEERETSRASGRMQLENTSLVPGVKIRASMVVRSETPAAAAIRPVETPLSSERPLYLGESVSPRSTGPAATADGQVPAGAGKGTGQETFSSATAEVPSVPSAQRSAGRTLKRSTGPAAPADGQVPAGAEKGTGQETFSSATAEVPSVPSAQRSAGRTLKTTHGDALESAMKDNYESFKNKGKQRGERPEIPPKPGCPPKSHIVPS